VLLVTEMDNTPSPKLFQHKWRQLTNDKMKSNFKEIINSETPVLVDFFADWCGPCKMLAPILKQVKDELGESVKIVKIDVDKNQPLAAEFQVRGVPTMILFKNGKQLWRQSGVLQKNDIVAIINQHSN
jgi:thioredoxin 1